MAEAGPSDGAEEGSEADGTEAAEDSMAEAEDFTVEGDTDSRSMIGTVCVLLQSDSRLSRDRRESSFV